ncbi:MAG: hypothetical protein IKZ82_11210 [Clostridia bacterium]|nr:hypothetical protein [Clostridia bacterium]
MLEMVKGCKVPHPERLFEQYSVDKGELIRINANVNASKIRTVLERYIFMQTDWMYFVLELPTHSAVERTLRKTDTDPMHLDVYYIDGLDGEAVMKLLLEYGDMLINDGMVRFGFGRHDSSSELMVYKYNQLMLFAKDEKEYERFFEEFGLQRVDELVTAWDTFSHEEPGKCVKVEHNGITIYDLPEKLAPLGIYFAERREE